ncbi:MAG: PilZ domain-containing protein [Nitrospira sp.]|nr:PilZ domain-containing protein [Nitrospira sp.]MBH0182563.1 PilZ domain-containing protein [Nitrospira sp.]MBH0184555.1 PilZ domain-containing protein [Nitrospira sp.]MBH0188941.1 PilZ domain-containing protein [Nitrospira sp.]MBH0195978.1 PilZ domain-containing protein [Nitrospira sp.]
MIVRQHPRFHASFSGTLIHRRERHAISKSLDLSRRGCRVKSTCPAFTGMKVDLLLTLPDSKTPIVIQGAVVRWSGSEGIGIEFPSLTSPYQELLEGAIQQLEARVLRGKHSAPISGRA